MKIKVNVWQVGYLSMVAYIHRDEEAIVCKERGYVELEEQDLWEEEVWHLLNWGCWNYNKEGKTVKPAEVHSQLDHCNSDIILQIEGTNSFKAAQSVGFKEYDSLNEAIASYKEGGFFNVGPLMECPRKAGHYTIKDDKVMWSKDNKNWEIVTW